MEGEGWSGEGEGGGWMVSGTTNALNVQLVDSQRYNSSPTRHLGC